MMKTTMKMLGSLAIAGALAMMTMTACSSDNDLVETPNAEQPTAKGVKVTVTAGISEGAGTRSAVTTEGTTRTLTFTAGDRLYVYGMIEDAGADPVYTTLAGYLDIDDTNISTDGKSATFTGTLDAYQDNGSGLEKVTYDFQGADPLARCSYNVPCAYLIHSGMKSAVYEISNVGMNFSYDMEKMYADDVETLMTTCLLVFGNYNSGSKSFALSSDSPIFNCTFSGLTASHNYSATLATDTWPSCTYNFTTNGSGIGTIAIASTVSGNYSRTITIKDGNTEVGTIDLGTKDMTTKVYNVKRNYGRAAFGKFIDLSTLTADFTAHDGDVLTGTFADSYKISIADGAKVTLNDVTIKGTEKFGYTLWAGITCEGDATILLSGTNTVKGLFGYPGISVPEEKTLTIDGTGSLDASSSVDNYGHGFAAGIGCGNSDTNSCGNIVIAGGTITATGHYAAGIGGGYNNKCGDITISGGTVTAYGEGGAAGIGAGFELNAECGNITISGGTVRAYGSVGAAGIGAGIYGSKCSNILISGGTITAVGSYDSIFDDYGAGIGTGSKDTSKCGSITITDGVTSVTAIRGPLATCSIGKGSDNGTCGTVTIDGTTTWTAGTATEHLNFVVSKTNNTNDTWTLTPK